jgi:hypothetical protein
MPQNLSMTELGRGRPAALETITEAPRAAAAPWRADAPFVRRHSPKWIRNPEASPALTAGGWTVSGSGNEMLRVRGPPTDASLSVFRLDYEFGSLVVPSPAPLAVVIVDREGNVLFFRLEHLNHAPTEDAWRT